MFSSLFSFVSTIQVPTPALAEAIASCLRKESFLKKTLLLKEGLVCDRLYFIEKGFVRAYYYKHEQEITSWFMQENEMIISVYSFFNQQPALENIETIEDSTLISISFDDLQRLYRLYPEFNFIGRVMAERYYCLSEERLMTMRMQSTQEKFDTLLRSHPEIMSRAALKHIASYLGMKPETLSRLRGQNVSIGSRKRSF